MVPYELTVAVTGVDCTPTEVGEHDYEKVASKLGKFCVVSFEVNNTSDAPAGFPKGSMRLVDTAGRRFDADQAATSVAGEVSPRLAPTQVLPDAVVFDVPADAEPDQLIFQLGFDQPRVIVYLRPDSPAADSGGDAAPDTASGNDTSVPPCTAEAFAAAYTKEVGSLPPATQFQPHKCEGEYGTAILSAPGQDTAIAVFQKQGADWVLLNVGTGMTTCSDVAVPDGFCDH